MLAPSAQIACAEHPECLCGAPGNLVTASRKGSRLLQSAFWEAGRGCFPPPGATFSALSNVRISLSSCHAASYGFPLPFFGASRAEGRNKRFSRIGQVKVSKCKGREDSAPIQTKTPAFEPGQTEPKPVVLPLHHSPNFRCFLLKSGAKIWLSAIRSKYSTVFLRCFAHFPYLRIWIRQNAVGTVKPENFVFICLCTHLSVSSD